MKSEPESQQLPDSGHLPVSALVPASAQTVSVGRLFLAIVAGGMLPLLAVFAWGSVFDSRGDDPFGLTMFRGIGNLFPLWILIGLLGMAACRRSARVLRFFILAEVTLLIVILTASLL